MIIESSTTIMITAKWLVLGGITAWLVFGALYNLGDRNKEKKRK
jgi:hypothetical protein